METVTHYTFNGIRILFAIILGVPLLILWIAILIVFTIALKILNMFATEDFNLTILLEETLQCFYISEEEEEQEYYRTHGDKETKEDAE